MCRIIQCGRLCCCMWSKFSWACFQYVMSQQTFEFYGEKVLFLVCCWCVVLDFLMAMPLSLKQWNFDLCICWCPLWIVFLTDPPLLLPRLKNTHKANRNVWMSSIPQTQPICGADMGRPWMCSSRWIRQADPSQISSNRPQPSPTCPLYILSYALSVLPLP